MARRGDHPFRAAIGLFGGWDPEVISRRVLEIAAEMGLPPSYAP